MPAPPSAATLLADGSRKTYVLKDQHSNPATSSITISRSQLASVTGGTGDSVNIDGRGWTGNPNGGRHGVDWQATHVYSVGDMVEPTTANGFAYKCTTAGTSASTEGTWTTTVGGTKTSGSATFTNVGATSSSNPTILEIGTFGGGSNPKKLAIIGSLPATPYADIMRIKGLERNNSANLFPLDPYRWSWGDRKGLDGWTGPNLDEQALRVSADPEAGTDWCLLIEGVWFENLNDATAIAAGAGSVWFRYCYFDGIGDDCVEADFSNTAVQFVDCLVRNSHTVYSATGSADRSALTTTLDGGVYALNRLPWRPSSSHTTCPNRALSNLTATDGRYWSFGKHHKHNGADGQTPRLSIQNAALFLPGIGVDCAAETGFHSSGMTTASGSTLRFGKGLAVAAGNTQACPQVPNFPDAWDSGAAFIPSGLTLTEDSVTYESQLASAVNTWLADTDHPQFVQDVSTIAERTLSSASATANSGQTVSVTPTGMVQGDVMAAVYATTGGTGTHTAPAGWTAVGAQVVQGGASLSAWRKTAGASEAGPYQWDAGSTGRRQGLFIRAFSGVDTGNPIDGTPVSASAGTATSVTHPASTSSGSGRWWILCTAKTTDTAVQTTLTNPSGFTETADICSTSGTLANINPGMHRKAVAAGSTGTQNVTSTDASTNLWAARSFLLQPAGATVVDAAGSVAGNLTLQASATVVGSSSPLTTTTIPSKAMGGGFENVGCFAPQGVGHSWKAAVYGDVFGTHISTDGVTWKPSNKGIGGPHHSIRTLRGSGIEGSQTVANRLWGWAGQTPDGTAGGNLIRGTYDPATGLVAWTNIAQAADGPAGGTTNYGHPRMLGRLLALDEANDTAYGCTVNGICRITLSTGAVTNARALAGEDVTGLVLDPTNPQTGWATVRRSYTGKTNTPGVYRIVNLRSGTVASTRFATLTDCQDLCLVDTGTTRYLFVAAMQQGIYRGTVAAADISTWTWTNITNDYEPGATVVGTGAAGIDAVWDGAQIQVLAVNAGNANLQNGGGYTRLGLNANPDWVNESPGWSVNTTPWGETDPWWLSVLIPGLMLSGTGYDSGCARIDPANPNVGMLVGRSGIWRSQNAWQTWRPAVSGTVGVMGWVIAARPNTANQALAGDGDWSLEHSTNFATTMPDPVRPRPGGGMGLMWSADGAEAAWACGDPFAGASEAGVFVSTNGGTTWVDQGLPAGVDAHGVAIGYNASGQRILLTVKGGGIQRKVGTGAWSQVSTLTVPQDSQAHNQHFCWPGNDDTTRRQWVYCTGHAGLLRSDDYGATWTTIVSGTNSGESAGAIAYDPAAPNTLYFTRDDGVGANTGLWKVTSANATPTATKIGPTTTAPGPCAVDPNTGVVYLAQTNLGSGGAKLWASPANNPGAATVFADITDAQWEHGVWAPCDMTVTDGGQILVANRQGGYFVATRAGGTAPAVANAQALLNLAGSGPAPVVALDVYDDSYGYGSTSSGTTGTLELAADATVVSAVAGIVSASAAITVGTSVLSGFADAPTTPAVVVEQWFNGVWWPRIGLQVGLNSAADPGAAYLHLNVGPGLDTALLGGGVWMDLAAGEGRNIRSITAGTPRGRDNPLDPAAPATITVVLNNAGGEYDPDNPNSPFVGLDIGCPIEVRAERPLGTIWRRITGEITAIVLDTGLDPTVTLTCSDVLEKLGRTQLTEVPVPVGDGDRSGARINRLLDDAGHPDSRRQLETGYTTVAPTALGDSALELLRRTEQTEFGWLFADGAGTVVFWDRHHLATAARSTTVQAIFTDTDAAGTSGMAELEVERSRDRIWNDVHITRDPTPQASGNDPDEPVEQVATDLNPNPAWGTLSMPATVGRVLVHDSEAKALAQYLLDRYNRSQPRVRRIRVNLLRKDLWDLLLPLQIGDRVLVSRDYGPNTITEELLIQAISEQITSDPSWELVLDLVAPPAAPTLWRLGTAALGSGKLGW